MALKRGVQYWLRKYYQDYFYYDHGLSLFGHLGFWTGKSEK